MEHPLISVIVPIYRIDRYLGLCIESIVNQTYKNLEILLVDDGGDDRCPELCDLYAKKDSRIRVIHKPNGGLISARKAGLRVSSGAYISYVDGDDWIGPGFLESLCITSQNSGADMVCAGYIRDLFKKTAVFANAISPGIYEGDRLDSLWKTMVSRGPFYCPGISTYLWNKLFRREILLDPQNRVDSRITIGEDGAVTYPALLRCSSVAVIDQTAYHYRQREDSMLKQCASYPAEARKLRFLYDYLSHWAAGTPEHLRLGEQVTDYVLSIALMRSGGRLPEDDFSTFDARYFGKDVIVYSAGTFGQQLVNRFRETKHCRVAAWLDDDYWEYRRCCMDVDPVERVVSVPFDYILLAAVNPAVVRGMIRRLLDYGVSREKILTVSVPEEKTALLKRFLEVENTEQPERGVISHA